MTKGTRYFLTGSALIVLLGLGTGLVAYYKGDLPMFRARIGPEELAYVPAEATALAYANVSDIMNSEFRQRLRDVLPTGQGKDEFFNETGIDIERDVQSVVAAVAGKGELSNHPLVMIRGSFDEARIEAVIRQHGGSVEDYKRKRLIIATESGEPASTSAFCLTFPESGLAMVGDVAAVKRAIDTHESGQNVTGNKEMMNLVSNLHGVGNTAWAVGGIDTVVGNHNVPAQVQEQLPGIEWVAVSAQVNGGLSGHLRAQAKDDKAATDLRAVVNGAVAAGHLMSGKNPKLDAFLSSLQVQGVGRDIDLAFNVPPDMLDMVGAVPGARKSLPAGPQNTR